MRNPWLEKYEKRQIAEAVEWYEENYIGFYNSSVSEEAVVPSWDFQTHLGDTIKAKYESQYVKIVEVTNMVNRCPFFYVS